MAAVEHVTSTQGGQATRWGVCSCGWAGDEHRGATARMRAAGDASGHLAEKAALAYAQSCAQAAQDEHGDR